MSLESVEEIISSQNLLVAEQKLIEKINKISPIDRQGLRLSIYANIFSGIQASPYAQSYIGFGIHKYDSNTNAFIFQSNQGIGIVRIQNEDIERPCDIGDYAFKKHGTPVIMEVQYVTPFIDGGFLWDKPQYIITQTPNSDCFKGEYHAQKRNIVPCTQTFELQRKGKWQDMISDDVFEKMYINNLKKCIVQL